jgi:topoisomerase-4 subunit A
LPTPNCELLLLSAQTEPVISYQIKNGSKILNGEIRLHTFVEVMGWKALGNKISDSKLLKVTEILPEIPAENPEQSLF